MNADASRKWLTDRTAELDAATAKLARLVGELAGAKSALAQSNGSLSVYTAARDRVMHVEHQIATCKQSIATCENNVQCAREGLAQVEREEQVGALVARRTERHLQAAEKLRKTNASIVEVIQEWQAVDALVAADLADVTELRALGMQAAPIVAVDALLLELLRAKPGTLPRAYVYGNMGQHSAAYEVARRQGLGSLLPLFELDKASPETHATYLASLGDARALEALPPPPAPLPEVEPVTEAYREGTSEHSVPGTFGLRYEVEHWHMPPDGHEQHRLVLKSWLRPSADAEFTSDEVIDLEFGLQCRHVCTADGGEFLEYLESSASADATADNADGDELTGDELDAYLGADDDDDAEDGVTPQPPRSWLSTILGDES